MRIKPAFVDENNDFPMTAVELCEGALVALSELGCGDWNGRAFKLQDKNGQQHTLIFVPNVPPEALFDRE